MLERDFKRKEQERFKKRGWVVIQLVAGSGLPIGFPDTLFLAPNGYRCFVEWKKSKNAKHQPLQDIWNQKLNNMSHDSFFIYPENAEEVLSIIFKKGEITK